MGWLFGDWRIPPPRVAYGSKERNPTAIPSRTEGSKGRSRRGLSLCAAAVRCSSDQAHLRSLSSPRTNWVDDGLCQCVPGLSCTRLQTEDQHPAFVNSLDESRTEIYTEWLYRSACLDPASSSVCAPSRSELAELGEGIWSNYQRRSLDASRPVDQDDGNPF